MNKNKYIQKRTGFLIQNKENNHIDINNFAHCGNKILITLMTKISKQPYRLI